MTHVRRIAFTGRVSLVVAMTSSALLACSSSTEPEAPVTPDGIRIEVNTDATRPAVNSALRVIMILENTNDTAVSRSFPASSIGPYPVSSSSAVEVDGFSPPLWSIDDGNPHVLMLGAHQIFRYGFDALAQQAGAATLKICFPKSDAGLEPSVCATRTVVVKASAN